MTKIISLDGDIVEIGAGPTPSAIIGTGLKNENYVVIVLKTEKCPKASEEKSSKSSKPEKSDTNQPADACAANADPKVVVTPWPNITATRFPFNVTAKGATPGRRAVAICDSSNHTIVDFMDSAIELVTSP
jgi:hypothetical protein